MKRIGLIVNPIAGMGGKVGLKGTDGSDLLKRARALGALPEAADKTAIALQVISEIKDQVELITCPGEMGEDVARQCGFNPLLIGKISEPTTGLDTEAVTQAMVDMDVDLIIFTGGDGTARNIYNVIGESENPPVIGIPAGVKIHSAVYATTPRNAGELARMFLQDEGLPIRRAEVMDIDEEAFREGRLSASLYGYLPVPCAAGLIQNLKVGGIETEEYVLDAIAEHVTENMENEVIYIIGPGSTISSIMKKLGLNNTLLGVDLVQNGILLGKDVNEQQILKVIAGKNTRIIVTVIGGQGYIFGRGNQQISAEVIRQVGKNNIIVVAVKEKILTLEQGRLLVDTGNDDVNKMLTGYINIITGYKEELVFPVSS